MQPVKRLRLETTCLDAAAQYMQKAMFNAEQREQPHSKQLRAGTRHFKLHKVVLSKN